MSDEQIIVFLQKEFNRTRNYSYQYTLDRFLELLKTSKGS